VKLTERMRSVLHALATASQGKRKLTWFSWLKPLQQSLRFSRGSLTRTRLYSAIGISGLVLVGASVLTVHHMNQTAPWMKVFSQGKYLGMVPNNPDILQKMQRVADGYHTNITLAPVHTTVSSSYDWRNVTTLPTSASAITLNGRPIVYTKDAKTAQKVLDEVKKALLPDNVKGNGAHDAQFVGHVSITSRVVSIASILDQVAAERYILNPNPDQMAARMGTVNSLLGMKGPKVSQISNEKAAKPLLQLSTEATITKTVRLPYHTKFVKDSHLGKGSVRVVTHGRSGVARETVKQEFVNGKLVGETVINKDVVKTPVTEIAHRGTNDGVASGSWSWPTSMHDVTSPFGPRSLGGGFHPGEDIGCPIGTPVYATNNGIVEDAGWNSGGYGNWVKINNGNGIESVFGHMSRVVAHAGERVSQGTLIGYSGDTGFVTGPHLHYEIRIYGRAVNPSPYM
jgi:murein DD-endopeptidase MepM/ murein hydrolase activator NlpD